MDNEKGKRNIQYPRKEKDARLENRDTSEEHGQDAHATKEKTDIPFAIDREARWLPPGRVIGDPFDKLMASFRTHASKTGTGKK